MPRKSQRRGRPASTSAESSASSPAESSGSSPAAQLASRPLRRADPARPIPRSAVSGVTWPALPAPAGALLLALQYQLGQSERWPAAHLDEMQFEVLQRVLAHAAATVPYYAERDIYGEVSTAAPLSQEAWSRLPVLTRAEVLEAGRTLGSRAAPADHAPLYETVTSGTTGPPVHVIGTRVTSTLWQAITLRDLSWHPRDMTGKLAAIRAEGADTIPPEGVDLPGWGAATDLVYDTGPCALLSIRQDVETQAEWLVRHEPDYLLSYPSNLLALANHFTAHGLKLGSLRGLTSYGEVLTPEVRGACRDTWGAEVVDMYSAQEVGYIALQCPKSESYHVQSESVHVEVLDDDGQACAPGQVGRVVVSTLHNLAMPLLRYEVGDLAEVGKGCPCGRTLPVLTRVAGRQS